MFELPPGPVVKSRPEPVRPSLMRNECSVKFQWTAITEEGYEIPIEDYKLEVQSQVGEYKELRCDAKEGTFNTFECVVPI